MPLGESKPNAEPTAAADSTARSSEHSDRETGPWANVTRRSRRPRVQVFYDQYRVPILDIVEVFGLRPGHLSDNRHVCSLGYSRGVEKLLLDGEEAPVRLLTVEDRALALIERQL